MIFSLVHNRLENIVLIKPPIMLAFMLKHCGNYAAILTNYASFLHLNTSVIRQNTCRNLNMNNQKHWYNPYFWLLQTFAGVSALSTFEMLADSD